MSTLSKIKPKAYARYKDHKNRASEKNIPFNLTFEEWYQFWAIHGYDKETMKLPITRDLPTMRRKDRTRGFEWDNIEIVPLCEVNRGLPRPDLQVQRPSRWIVKDPELHARYQPWLRARAQAHYRGETWSLSFEDWCVIWNDETWPLRGRGPKNLSMNQIDPQGGWHLNNVILMTRREQIQRRKEFK